MIAQAFSRGGLTIRHLGYLANSLSSPNKWMFPVITNKICYLLSYENKIYYLLICLNYRIDFLIKAFSSKKKKKNSDLFYWLTECIIYLSHGVKILIEILVILSIEKKMLVKLKYKNLIIYFTF